MNHDCLSAIHQNWVDSASKKNAYYDVYWLMAHYLNISFAQIHVMKKSDFDQEKWCQLSQGVQMYLSGKPLEYIIGTCFFYGLEIYVSEGVLIPRSDTEEMVSYLIGSIPKGARVLEMGVGSGAISIALAMHRKDISIVGFDNCQEAINIARKNIVKHGLQGRVTVNYGDWNQSVEEGGFDWVVSNPPYIDINDQYLEENVRTHEPESALIASNGGDGDLYRIVDVAKGLFKEDGMLTLEHGWRQQERLCKHLEASGYCVELKGCDSGQNPRFVSAKINHY